MGWFSRKTEQSAAERSLEALHQASAAVEETAICLQLVATPSRRTPGSPLAVLNEADPVSVGTPVQLVTFRRVQETRIVAMTRDGVPVEVLDADERGEVVLDDGVDLSDVYRTALLQDAGTEGTFDDGVFMLQVASVEQVGRDVLVAGPYAGSSRPGARASLEPTIGDDEIRWVKIKEVRPESGGRLGLLLDRCDAQAIEIGDEVHHLV